MDTPDKCSHYWVVSEERDHKAESKGRLRQASDYFHDLPPCASEM